MLNLAKNKGRTQGKGLSVMKTALAQADRMSSSRHQRRKMEKLAKKYPDQFLQAKARLEDERR